MRRSIWAVVTLTLSLMGCEPELCWSEGDPEPRACEEYVVDRGCDCEVGEDREESIERVTLEDAWIGSLERDGGSEEPILDQPTGEDDGIDGPLPEDEALTFSVETPGGPVPSAAELRVADREPPARVPYEFGDLDVSELGHCSPRPSCIEPMVRATSPDAVMLVFDGRTLTGHLAPERTVLIADVPRGRLLELPAGAQVQMSGAVVTFCTSSCQAIDLVRGEIDLSETMSRARAPSS